MRRILLGCLFLGSLGLLGCTDAANQKNVEPGTIPTQPASENRVPAQYIVSLKEDSNTQILTEVFQQYGIKSIKDLSRGRYVITLEQDPGPDEISKQAATSTEILSVQPNYIYRATPPLQQKPQQTQ
jgi:hypothetical protein